MPPFAADFTAKRGRIVERAPELRRWVSLGELAEQALVRLRDQGWTVIRVPSAIASQLAAGRGRESRSGRLGEGLGGGQG